MNNNFCIVESAGSIDYSFMNITRFSSCQKIVAYYLVKNFRWELDILSDLIEYFNHKSRLFKYFSGNYGLTGGRKIKINHS